MPLALLLCIASSFMLRLLTNELFAQELLEVEDDGFPAFTDELDEVLSRNGNADFSHRFQTCAFALPLPEPRSCELARFVPAR